MTPRVSDLIEIINSIAPFRYAEEWDNVGLQVGDPSAEVSKIMVALDATSEAIDAALAENCQLLLTHHPLIFRGLHHINLAEPAGILLAAAIRNSLNIVSLHTNFDVAEGGVNDLLAAKLEVDCAGPLSVTAVDELVKLVVFVPKGYEEQVMQALFPFSGIIGNYCECSFQVEGTGTFKPLTGASPFIGSLGSREYVSETRIEVLLRKRDMAAAVASLAKAHPYEEPAMDFFPLLNDGMPIGIGRIGELAHPVLLEQFVSRIKEGFAVEGIRYVGNREQLVHKVALCGGSGASFLGEAHRQGADVLVTGDVKYHDAREAQALGIALVDLGHFASEAVMVEGLVALLERKLLAKGFVVELAACGAEKDPFRYR